MRRMVAVFNGTETGVMPEDVEKPRSFIWSRSGAIEEIFSGIS